MRDRFSKVLVVLMAVALVASFGAGCAKKAEPAAEAPKSDIKTAMVTDVGGLGDKSFNDAAWAGLEKAKADLGVETKVLESKEMVDYESNITQLADAGYDPIFTVGFLMQDAVAKMAKQYPDTSFASIDTFFDKPDANLVGLLFKEQEAGYLAGVVAGLATKDTFDSRLNADNVVGFVGGMDIPPVERYEVGFVAGVKSVNPTAKVIILYAGKFDDQGKGKELGLSLIDQKADVLFAAAGQTGLGTIKACQERGALFIGVDVDQFDSVAGSGDVMLTSAIKRVDEAVYNTVKQANDKTFAGGQNITFGLKEGGVGLAPFHDFDTKVSQAIKDAVEKAKQDILSGSVTVPATRAK